VYVVTGYSKDTALIGVWGNDEKANKERLRHISMDQQLSTCEVEEWEVS
jgi:hypothetical protein